MKHFAALYSELDSSTKTNEKVDALARYFSAADPRDSAWALALFTGQTKGRTLPMSLVRQWACEAANLPAWMVDECNLVVGDWSETLSLLLPDSATSSDVPLHQLMQDDLASLSHQSPAQQKQTITRLWSILPRTERFLLHKLMGGSFRVGASKVLVIRALSQSSGIDVPTLTRRLMGKWTPDEAFMRRLIAPAADIERDPMLPFPFMLASPLQEPLSTLGETTDWHAEWKWDGIRAQVIHRTQVIHRATIFDSPSATACAVWSRGEEVISPAFPEIIGDARQLPPGTVLDGEILAWNVEKNRPEPFSTLQTRLNRKEVVATLWPDVTVRFVAFDILEHDAVDLRTRALRERRSILEALTSTPPFTSAGHFRVSEPIDFSHWHELDSRMSESRERQVEGLMLKRLDSVYRGGRMVGQWWKRKVDALTLDAVLVAAQPGRGRRAGLLTDYTFAVLDDAGKWVTICKAYSGLSDEELTELDRYVRRVSTQRFGPVYSVEPDRVYEIAFEAIAESDRHKSGLAVRFPRVHRRRVDKTITQADTVASLRALLARFEGRD